MSKISPSNSKHYHDTLLLLKKYRDVVWSLELSVQQAKLEFRDEYGSEVEDFLAAIRGSGADISGSELERYAQSIERSHKMLRLVDAAVSLIRAKHKDGERIYWVLYYSFLSSQKCSNLNAIIDALQKHIKDVSYSTYYRLRNDAVSVLSSVLWGYSSRESQNILEQFFPA